MRRSLEVRIAHDTAFDPDDRKLRGCLIGFQDIFGLDVTVK